MAMTTNSNLRDFLFRHYSIEDFELKGITNQGHALCIIQDYYTVVIKKKDYNKLLMGCALEGKPVLWKQEPNITYLFKTLQF